MMENRKRKIYGAAMMAAVLMIGATGCKSNTNVQEKDNNLENQTGKQIENQTGTSDTSGNVVTVGSKENETFADLLEKTNDIEELYTYIENNAEGATKEEWDEWIRGITNFGEGDAEYDRFQEYRGNMSEEMKSFVELMSAEQARPSFNEEGNQLTLGEILERCIAIEQHMTAYGKGDTYSILYPKYCQLINAAITGGYDGLNIETNEYLEKDKKHIRTNVIEEYERTIKDNPDSETADILEDYVKVLKENDNIVNKNVEKFYGNIYEEVDEKIS